MSACDATTKPEPPLLHICYAPVDQGWVRGRMLPALGLTAGQYRTREDDGLGELHVAEIARAVEDCRYTVLIASRAARWDRWVQLAADLAQHVSIEQQTPRLFIIALDALPGAAAASGRLPLLQRALVELDCTNEQRTEQSLARLGRLLGLVEPVSRPPACPYPGLEHFTAANRHLMFGRDRDRDAAQDTGWRCPRGSGRSSHRIPRRRRSTGIHGHVSRARDAPRTDRADGNGRRQGELDDEERWLQDRLAVYAALLDGDESTRHGETNSQRVSVNSVMLRWPADDLMMRAPGSRAAWPSTRRSQMLNQPVPSGHAASRRAVTSFAMWQLPPVAPEIRFVGLTRL